MAEKTKYKYELRQVDAYRYDDEWVYNTTYLLAEVKTAAEDMKKFFRRKLKQLGIQFSKPVKICSAGDLLELYDFETGEPLFALIPMF